MNSFLEIHKAFLSRRVKINSPAQEESINKLIKLFSIAKDDPIVEMYRTFDGFDKDFDEMSFINIWSIERSIKFSIKNDRFDKLSFADLAMEAVVYALDLHKAGNPVF